MSFKLAVQPEQTVRFPGICPHCGQPAPGTMPVQKRIGRVTRHIDVPVCLACAQTLRRRSAQEERYQQMGKVAAAVTAVLALALTVLATSGTFVLLVSVLLGLLVAGVLATAVWLLFQRLSQQAILPAKQAILDAARITDFSWRSTTFDFGNETFRQRFQDLNEALLMDV